VTFFIFCLVLFSVACSVTGQTEAPTFTTIGTLYRAHIWTIYYSSPPRSIARMRRRPAVHRDDRRHPCYVARAPVRRSTIGRRATDAAMRWQHRARWRLQGSSGENGEGFRGRGIERKAGSCVKHEVTKEAVGILVLLTRSIFACGTLRSLLPRVLPAESTSAPLRF
jgi:hypothetical protein